MEQVWDIFSEELYLTYHFYDLKIHSFVLMSNHFHLIASTPMSNISTCMQYFMKNCSLRLTRAGNRINGTFAGRHYKTILQHPNYYLNAYKYNYQNPVSAKITKSVEDYPYSTLYGLTGKKRLYIPVEEDQTLFSSFHSTMDWLNRPINEINKEAMKWALKRKYFQSKKCKNTRRIIIGEDDLI